MSYLGFSRTIFNINKRSAISLIVAGGLLSITVPIGLSLYWAWKYTLDVQAEHTASIANEVLRRSSNGINQVVQFIYPALAKAEASASAPCSSETIELMKKLDLQSDQVQTVAYVKDDTLLCSAYGLHNIPLGPPTYTTPMGTKIWTSHELPILPGTEFLLISQKGTGYTAVILSKTLLNVFINDPDVSVGLISLSSKRLIVGSGIYEPSWLEHLGKAKQVEFIDGENFVVLRRSDVFELAAFAVIPVANLNKGLNERAIILVPIGIVAGALLVFAVLSLMRHQLTLVALLKVALKRKEFSLLYQPIVDLQTGLWVGAEALIRWRRPAGETIPPDVFIKVAEDDGLIQEITTQVMEMVGQDAQQFFALYPDFHIAINLSAADLESPQTIKELVKLTKKTGAGRGNLLIEATERGFLEADLVKGILHEIRKLGVHVAIDDFGTGYSNLSYLETFELDYLKIDKSFVDTLGKDSATSQVVPHIIEMAKSLKLIMIAEGVETEAQAQYLRDHGVQLAQGWLFAKPMPFSELVAGLSAFNKC